MSKAVPWAGVPTGRSRPRRGWCRVRSRAVLRRFDPGRGVW